MCSSWRRRAPSGRPDQTPLPPGEDFQRVHRQADLHVGLRAPVVVDAVLRLVELGVAVAVGDAGLVFDHFVRAQEIGGCRPGHSGSWCRQLPRASGRAACRPATPELSSQLEGTADFGAEALILAEPHQPVERDFVGVRRWPGASRRGAGGCWSPTGAATGPNGRCPRWPRRPTGSARIAIKWSSAVRGRDRKGRACPYSPLVTIINRCLFRFSV